jgi:hypothetical protein
MDDWRKYKNIDDYQHRIDLELQELKNSPVKITPRLKYYTENYAIRCEDAERYRIRAYKLLEEAVKDEEVLFKLQRAVMFALSAAEDRGYTQANLYNQYDKDKYSDE